MTWRSSTSSTDRIFASLPYLLPLMDVILSFGQFFFLRFPDLQILLLPIQPLLTVYLGLMRFIPFGGFIVFLALYMLVVRNESIHRFIRFNAMQSILIGIVVSLASLVWFSFLAKIFSNGLINETIANVLFLGTVALVVYSIVQAARGRYAEIPTLSEAADVQTR